MTHDDIVAFASSAGLIYFIILFVAVLVYALWPANKRKFDAAARSLLKED